MKVVKLKMDIPEITIAISFFRAVVLIHQSETYSELDEATTTIDSALASFDATDYGQLRTMITNQRNRIERNKRI